MLTAGTVIVWCALGFVILSSALYLLDRNGRSGLTARVAYLLSVASIVGASVVLGILFVTHRFDCAYVYEHSARAMAPLYWFPSFWSGQEGSFLLWAFWACLVGAVLSFTSGTFERRVMPIYSGILIFLLSLLTIKSPFVPLDTQGGPVPTEGLGLNPNLENPWMVIHPPTLFLGFATLGVPFAYAIAGLIWERRIALQGKSTPPAPVTWLRQAMPWALVGFSVLGLAMMMGGYWAYEMLGWGGFWGWDPVENGPLIPWLILIGFLHISQIARFRERPTRGVALYALLPFLTALYETFLTRTGILSAFSVHSFSTLGGVANSVILYVMLGAMGVSLILLLVYPAEKNAAPLTGMEELRSREFAYLMAVALLSVCAAISALGMSAPLITGAAMKLHLTNHVASAPEIFYNKATFPLGVLLAIGMGLGPQLSWRGKGEPGTKKLVNAYAIAVGAAFLFVLGVNYVGTMVRPMLLCGELVLFTSSMFAIASNAPILWERIVRGSSVKRAFTLGGTLSHIGAAMILIGITFLVCFTHKTEDLLLPMGTLRPALNGAYTMTYMGQTGDFKTDRNNALMFDVVSSNGREHFTAYLPFALRALEDGEKKLFSHPAIVHHAGGDLYIALRDGPDEQYKSPLFQTDIPLGGKRTIGSYTLQLVRFDRDPAAAAYVAQTGQMPPVFPVTAVMRITHDGKTTIAQPKFITYRDNPDMPDTPEVKLPDGWLLTFMQMNAGSSNSADPNAGAASESGTFGIRQDSGPPIEAFEIDVTTRPMVWLVWAGTLFLVLGGLLAAVRHARDARRDPTPELVSEVESKSGRGRGRRRRNGPMGEIVPVNGKRPMEKQPVAGKK